MEQIIRVSVPTAPAARGRHYPSVQRLVDALASLPPEARRNIHAIRIEPRAHMTDRSVTADADAAGEISYYPQPTPESPSELAGTLAHESGHVISERNWGVPPRDRRDQPTSLSSGWLNWQSAIAADGFHTSAYGETDIEDDFAETFRLYMTHRGRPELAQARALLPNRFARIENLLRDDAARHTHPAERVPYAGP